LSGKELITRGERRSIRRRNIGGESNAERGE